MNHALRVVGIAGPGEPLYNRETFKTLALVHEHFPLLNLCLSTNGLLLPQKADLLADLGVKTVTVTINAVHPPIVEKIYAHIGGKINENIARSFTEQQLQGITACTTRGIHVKINSIVIPSINAGELTDVARHSRKRGACIQNITPLIPLSDFSTLDPPSHSEIVRIRERCAEYLPQFTCCKQCSADAAGIPGKGDRF
jgi:nitrogen fixation protein NifB